MILKVVELEEEGDVGHDIEEDGLQEHRDEVVDPAPFKDGDNSRDAVQLRPVGS